MHVNCHRFSLTSKRDFMGPRLRNGWMAKASIKRPACAKCLGPVGSSGRIRILTLSLTPSGIKLGLLVLRPHRLGFRAFVVRWKKLPNALGKPKVQGDRRLHWVACINGCSSPRARKILVQFVPLSGSLSSTPWRLIRGQCCSARSSPSAVGTRYRRLRMTRDCIPRPFDALWSASGLSRTMPMQIRGSVSTLLLERKSPAGYRIRCQSRRSRSI